MKTAGDLVDYVFPALLLLLYFFLNKKSKFKKKEEQPPIQSSVRSDPPSPSVFSVQTAAPPPPSVEPFVEGQPNRISRGRHFLNQAGGLRKAFIFQEIFRNPCNPKVRAEKSAEK